MPSRTAHKSAIVVVGMVVVAVFVGVLGALRSGDVVTLTLVILVIVFGAAATALWLVLDAAERNDES